jgi:DNA repair ATPase RecN
MKSNMPYKDTDGVYKNYCAKGIDAIALLHNVENEVHRKVFEIALDEFLKLEDRIDGYEKLIKQYRNDMNDLHKIIQNLNKEIREMKEGING